MKKKIILEDHDGKQLKHTVTYRNTKEEKELYDWVESKSIIGGPCTTIKNMLYDLMKKEKDKKI